MADGQHGPDRHAAARLAGCDDRTLVNALADTGLAEAAAALLRERIGDNPELVDGAVLAAVAAVHDVSRRFPDGSSGPLPAATLRAVARAEIARRGGEAWRALCPEHDGVRCVAALEGHEGEVRRLAAAGGSLVVSAAAGEDRLVWDAGSGRAVARLGPADGFGDGALLRRHGAELRLSRLGREHAEAVLPVPAGEVRDVAGGRFVLVEGGPSGAAVSVRSLPAGAVAWSRGGYEWDSRSGDTLDLALSPGGRFLAIGQAYGSRLEAVDLDSGRTTTFASDDARECLLALGPEPLAVIADRGAVGLRDLATGATDLDCGRETVAAAVDPDGSAVLVAGGGRVALLGRDGERLWERPADGLVDRVALAPAGGAACALVRGPWSEDERAYRPSLRLWRRNGTPLGSVDSAYSVAFLAGAAAFATGGRWGTTWLWAPR